MTTEQKDKPDFKKWAKVIDTKYGKYECVFLDDVENIFNEWLEKQRRANIYIECKGLCDCIVIQTGKSEGLE